MLRRAVIDFTAFVDKERKVIIKELSVIDVDSKCIQHWILKPPKIGTSVPYNKTSKSSCFTHYNRWLIEHFHGLDYHFGHTEYESLWILLNCICSEFKLLFNLDLEKARVIEQIFDAKRAVLSLEALGCPPKVKKKFIPMFPPEVKNMCDELDGIDPNSHSSGKQAKKSVGCDDNGSCLLHLSYAHNFYCTQSAVKRLARLCEENENVLDVHSSP